MRKLTTRLTAMLLSGMLIFGSVPGAVFAADAQEDPGQTSAASEEVLNEDMSEAPASAGESYSEETSYSEEASAEEEAIYTVTLDANGGYFENEWDDAVGDYVEKTEVIEKQIPVGGTVAVLPVFSDQDGQTMLFAGWSLEPNGELVSEAEGEYVPSENCVLYAVWEAAQEGAGVADTAQETDVAEESEDSEAVEETESAQEYDSAETAEDTETGSEDTEEVESAQEYEETADEADTVQETAEDINVDSEEYTAPEADNEQDAKSAQDAVYSDAEEEESSDGSVAEEEITPDMVEPSEEEETVKEEAANGVVESGTCGVNGDNLTWTLDDAGTLTISGTGAMEDYVSDGFRTPWYQSSIKTVIIDNGVSNIGSEAFSLLDNLTSVTIPDSVTYIGRMSFEGCENLTNIRIPNGVKSIGQEAFLNCTNLKDIIIPNGVTSIKKGVFDNCRNLETVTIPNSVTSIGTNAFYNCVNLKSVTIPNSVTTISEKAFAYCNNLTKVTIKNGVANIGRCAFARCSSLTSVTIPSSVTKIEVSAFSNCKNLKVINFRGNAPTIADYAFYDVLAIAYYPANDPTWTDSKKANYGGVITWKEDASGYDDFMSTGSGRFTSLDMYGFNNFKTNISKRIYEKFFSKSQAKELFEKHEEKKHALCYGMVITAMATLLQGSPSVSSYGVNSLYDIADSDTDTESRTTGKTVLEYIKYAYISQFLPAVQIAQVGRNRGDLQGLYYAVLDYAKGATDKPVHIHIEPGEDEEGHALWALGVSEANTTKVTIDVYDCNHKGENRKLYLFKKSGRFTGWEYTLEEGRVWSGDENSNLGGLSYDTVSMEYFVLNYATNVLYETGDYNILITFDMSDSQYSSSKEWANEQQKMKKILPIYHVATNESQDSSYIQNYWYMSSQGDFNLENIPANVKVSYTTVNDSFSVSSNKDYSVSFSGESTCKDLRINSKNGGEFTTTYYKPDNNSDHVDQLSITGSGETIEINNNDGNLQVTGVDNMYVSLESGEEDEEGIILDPKVSTHEDVNLSTDDNINIGISDSGDLSVETIKILSNGTCGDNIKWKLDSNGVLKLSGKGVIPDYFLDMVPHAPWLYEKVNKVVVGNGITRIGNYAFYYMDTLQEAILPTGLQEIGTGAFEDCQNLKTVSIPSSVEFIDGIAFDGTAWMTDRRKQNPYVVINGILIDGNTVQGDLIEIPANVKKIAPFSFLNKANYTSVVIPEGVEFIGEGSFYRMMGRTELSTVSLPKSIGKIEANAFKGRDIDTILYGGTPSDWEKLNISKDDNQEIYYACTISYTFVPINKAVISGITDKTYSGKQISQTPTLKIGSSILKINRDYNISYSNNTNAGTAKLVITGIGDYTGTKTATFTINKAPQSITAKAAASSVAVGKTTTVTLTGNKGSKSFKSSDTSIATVTSAGKVTAKKVGTVKITATSAATANYKVASKTVTIKVVPATTASLTATNQAKGIKLTWKKVTGATGYKIYRGSTLIKTIASGSTVTYTDTKANTNGTKYTFKIVAKAGTGDSTLSKSLVTYRITQPEIKALKNNGLKKVNAAWKKNTKASGYQLEYSSQKSFKTKKSVTVRKADSISKAVTGLTTNNLYFFRVRSYKKVNEKTYYSSWSQIKANKTTASDSDFSKALKAYVSLLQKKTVNVLPYGEKWIDIGRDLEIVYKGTKSTNVMFEIACIDNDIIPELILSENGIGYGVWTYVNGKVTLLLWEDSYFSPQGYYKKKGIFVENNHPDDGDRIDTYYTRVLNGGISVVLQKTKWKKKSVTYYSGAGYDATIIPALSFKEQLKKYTGTTSMTKISFKKNTAKNRDTYISDFAK